jgi:hypothetical protein
MGEKGKVWDDPLLSETRQSPAHPTNKILILFMDLCVKTLAALGRNYPWQRPERCPRCSGARVWGHGFALAYFDQAGKECVWLRRYRCPECRAVIRVRPSGYWKRIQASIEAVRQCVIERIETGRWPPGSNPPRQRHWLCGLRRQVRTHLGMSYADKLVQGFSELVRLGVCAVSRAV